MNLHTCVAAAILAFLLQGAGTARADGQGRQTLPAAYKEECGSCHVPYPPGLLPASSWKAIMAGLAKHFGNDASLEAEKAREIGDFLAAHAGRPERHAATSPSGGPILRITDTRWFIQEHRDGHDGLSAALWRSPAVKTPANCAACHRNAADGDYRERNIRLPQAN